MKKQMKPELLHGEYTAVFVKSGAAGNFTVTATGSDAESAIASASYPDLVTGWTRTSGTASRTCAQRSA